MTDDEATLIIRTASNLVLNAAMDLLYVDPHSWSSRPCPTCRPITAILGKPFGCYRYQQEAKAKS